MSADTSAAGVARSLTGWRLAANAYADIDHGGIAGCLRQACDLIEALAAERDELRDMLADRNALATDYAKVTAERDVALSTLAAARRARVADDVADRLAHMRDGAR